MKTVEKEDYEEPLCPFCRGNDGKMPSQQVPLDRVLEKLDAFLNTEDWNAAGRHLAYWLAEAEALGDRRAALSLENERMGFCRKQGLREEAFSAADRALSLLRECGLSESLTAGTTLVNAATVYQAFGQATAALPLFAEARQLFERYLPENDRRLGGLFNNMGRALTEAGRPDEALAAYGKALAVMSHISGSEPEQAITQLNRADCFALSENEEAANACLAEAERLLKTPGLSHDAYFSYVCGRCAPVFAYHGWFAAAAELRTLGGLT